MTGEQKILGDGIDPVLSKDDSLMAYHITQQSNTLYIKNLENNKRPRSKKSKKFLEMIKN